VLGRDEIRALEPEITPKIAKTVLFPDNRSLRDPHRYVTRLVQRFEALGGEVRRAEAVGFEHAARIEGVRLSDGTVLRAAEVVIAAGAFSARLARRLGEAMPLETEHGYHTQIMAPGLSSTPEVTTRPISPAQCTSTD